MEVELYEQIFTALAEYVPSRYTSYTTAVCRFPPQKPTYPLVIFNETRNVPYSDFKGFRERVASLGYKLDIYARGETSTDTKQKICRDLAKVCDTFLTGKVGLKQVSWNTTEYEGVNGELYHIMITYSTAYHENKQRIL